MREPRLLLNRIDWLEAVEIISWKFFLLSDSVEVCWDTWLKALWNGFKLCCSQSSEEHSNRTAIIVFNCSTVFAMEKLDTVLAKDLLTNGFGCYCTGNTQWGKAKEIPPEPSDCPCTCNLSTNRSTLVKSAINSCKLENKTAWLSIY